MKKLNLEDQAKKSSGRNEEHINGDGSIQKYISDK